MAFGYYYRFNKKRKSSKQLSKKILLAFIYLLIAILKSFSFLYNLLAQITPILILKPGRAILRFVFYKIVIKFYRFYLYILKKTGLREKNSSWLFYLQQKFVHLIIVLLTVVLVYVNTSMRTQAQTLPTVNKTILANIVQSEFGSLEEGDLVEEVFNEKEVALQFKSAVNQANSLSLKAPLAVTQQGFVEFKETENNPDALSWSGITPNLMASEQTTKNSSIQIVKKRDKIITYVVQPGDTVSTIAQKFGLTVNTILWENNLSPYSLIHPGDKLSILPVSGVTHTVKKGETIGRIARDYGVKIEKILEANHLKITSTLAIGQKLIIPDGRKRTYVARKTKTYSGISVIKKLVQTPRRSSAVSSNKMAWPTVGHRITQYFSWRHNGLDIANRIGTPIFAADAGVIEYAGWGRGYGNYILINHGGGKKTRYAHLSRFYVSKGQKVAKGQTIAAMGSTGWSTGPHLHFEVIINGRRYNPLNYIR